MSQTERTGERREADRIYIYTYICPFELGDDKERVIRAPDRRRRQILIVPMHGQVLYSERGSQVVGGCTCARRQADEEFCSATGRCRSYLTMMAASAYYWYCM